eukprot:gnl/MRDRNA2_/MRDRNA2_34210_c0_seq1.p1 gnl/MRDRNA2_/MRDRNA2_34210_c0~~gnl/MRDRNA2_/MRDRNA2_34210_c0_seq1.p1  ORF type:complete len:279 (+),score=70.85 gnl/MRDRNA2_/MRDRNA2_34210_c0_seq1:119-955(+)
MTWDASKISRKHKSGSSVAGLMNHEAPPPLRNHARDNMLAIRSKEKELKDAKDRESCKEPETVFKLKQFEHVKSRIHEVKPPRAQEVLDSPHRRRLDSELPSSERRSRATVASERSSSQPSCLRNSSSLTDTKKRCSFADDNDGEEMNMDDFEAAAERLKRLHGNKAKDLQTFAKDSNNCPAYLRQIKANLADEQRRAAESRNPRIPPGYRMMPDEERLETLHALQKKKEEMEKEFQRLPLKIETDAQKRRQKMVMDKIKETDAAIAVFSKPTVIVEA